MTPTENFQKYLDQGWRYRYGKWWKPANGVPVSDLFIESQAFLHNIQGPECPGKPTHFKNIVNLVWNHKNSTKKFIWNPWAERMLENACRHKYLGVAGCASSGKTDFFALWGIVNYLVAPESTAVMYTSISLDASRKRIWGTVEKYWQAAALLAGSEDLLKGRLISSRGIIRYQDHQRHDDTLGLCLVAGEASKEKESSAKLQGRKAPRLFLILDEMPELSHNLLETAKSNLSANQGFTMIGIGNPTSYFDPFGIFCKPRVDWDNLPESADEWETDLGHCIRFDAERSPNVLAGKDEFPFLVTNEALDAAKARYGERSMRYYQMYRGFWCPTGTSDGVVSQADIVQSGSGKPAVWREPPVMVGGFDVAFTDGGDRCVLYPAKCGATIEGVKTVEYQEPLEINEDVEDKHTPRTHQIVARLREACEERGIHLRYLAIDETGGGKPFCDVVRSEWGPDFLPVNFGSAPTDLPASGTDPTPCSERYLNRVTELWYSIKEHIEAGQIRGIGNILAKELCARLYELKGKKLQVEPKKKMKVRTGESPDYGDAAALALAVCRHRLGLASKLAAKKAAPPDGTWVRTPFRKFAQKLQRMIN